MRQLKRHSRFGFTLIELLIAMMLSVFLLLVVGQILRLSVRESRAAAAMTTLVPAVAMLGEQLRHDIVNARQYQAAGDELRLVGFIGTSRAIVEPSLQGAAVVYRVSVLAGTPWLVREEYDAGGRMTRREPMMSGVASISVRADADLLDEDAPRDGLPPLPENLDVLIGGTDGRMLFVEHISHHVRP